MSLTVERKSPTTLVFTRSFAAPPERVFAAHIDPALVKRWMLGPDGWSMPVCELDPRPGGKMRIEWRNDENGASFSLTGEYRVVEAPHRIAHTERMHLPDPTPENRVETHFAREGKGTRMTMTMTVDDPATMEAMIASGMSDGMEKSYARLEPVLHA